MALICFFDIFVEFFDIFPNWQRRQLLILDDFLRFLYGESELWNQKLYGFAFRKSMFKRCVKAHEYNFELYQTKLAYGEEIIQ
jgi:hypothetical protein